MLAAPTTPPKPVTSTSNNVSSNTIMKYQKTSFDTFDSPFHTPSLFGTTNSTTTATTNYENYRPQLHNINNNNNKYDAFYAKDEFRLFNNNHHYHHHSSSSPESFFSVMADLESSGTRTPSPKNECYDTKEDLFKMEPLPPPFLYNRKAEPTTTLNNQQQQDQILYPTNNDAFGLFYNNDYNDVHHYIAGLSNDIVRQKLKDSLGTIQRLYRQLNLMSLEVEKKQIMVVNYRSTLANKDLEFQEQDQRLSMANQYCESQTKKLNAKQAEIALYQSLIKSKGLELPTTATTISGEMAVTMESSEIKFNRLCKLREFPETSKSMETTSSVMRNESDSNVYCNTGRRWSEERTPLGIVSSSSTTTSSSCAIETERKQNGITTTTIEYRRMLDKNVNHDWDSLVDRITKSTDQQTSIFLQQKLKCATADQKQLIFQAILKQAHELMTNKFGNFLVQRVLELGTEEQIQALADAMKGHILELTCEPFGCHVVQKALDYVSEPVKASLVSELFVRISDTITHKYACHVWQKVFEIRWLQTPPPIMKYVHEALESQWALMALDETGSLVIQNIFENLTEDDKRPVLDEVLKNTVSIAKGQWGNWVIQHILEQAEKSYDREAAFQIVIEEGVQLSMDQFASKVVEKALRIGGQEFLTKFVQHISKVTCTHRPRMPLIDIASDQYGNYVVQWLINNACDEQKVSICRLIKRHMVSLRGSKYGQRVAFLVERVLRNNEITTYPQQATIKNFN